MTLLPLHRERVTTLTAPSFGPELAAVTAAIAVSCKTGVEIIAGWRPSGTGEVSVHNYAVPWLRWRTLLGGICDAVSLAVPMVGFWSPSVPLAEAFTIPADPDWHAARPMQPRPPEQPGAVSPIRLQIVLGAVEATGFGFDGAMAALYRSLEGLTALVVGTGYPFATDTWGPDEKWAGDYGPVWRLRQVGESRAGVSDISLSSTAGDHEESLRIDVDMASDAIRFARLAPATP